MIIFLDFSVLLPVKTAYERGVVDQVSYQKILITLSNTKKFKKNLMCFEVVWSC